MSIDLTAEQRAAAQRMHLSGTSLKDLILRNGAGVGLEAQTVMNVANEFLAFTNDLNMLTGMKFDVAPGFTEDKAFRAGSLVAAVDQIKKSVRTKTKEEVTGLVICTPTYRLRNTLLGQDFTIYLEAVTPSATFVLGMNDQGQAVMSQRYYWEEPRQVVVPQEETPPAEGI